VVAKELQVVGSIADVSSPVMRGESRGGGERERDAGDRPVTLGAVPDETVSGLSQPARSSSLVLG
jgi:hypothetical protein